MGLVEDLKSRGWFLSAEGIEECTEGLENPKAEDVIRKAVNYDLVDIGEGGLSEDVTRNKVETMTGPVVVQIQKVRNVSAPKSNPESDHSQSLLRLHLTDGTSYCSAIQWGKWSNISLSTPPGSKILLKNEPIPVVNGFLLLAERDFKFLGGNVSHLIEKWELAKNLSHHKRIIGEEGAAPPWVPFGHKIDAGGLKNMKGKHIFSLSMDLCQKDTKPNESFEKHRQLTIAEISRTKEGKVKVFGGGKQVWRAGLITTLLTMESGVREGQDNANLQAAILKPPTVAPQRGSERKLGSFGALETVSGYSASLARTKDSLKKYCKTLYFCGPNFCANQAKGHIRDPLISRILEAAIQGFYGSVFSRAPKFREFFSSRNSRKLGARENKGFYSVRHSKHILKHPSTSSASGTRADRPWRARTGSPGNGPIESLHCTIGNSSKTTFNLQGRHQETNNWNSSPSPSWTNHQAYGGRPASRDPPLAPLPSDVGDRRRPTVPGAETVQNARPPPTRERNIQEATRPAQQRRITSGQKVLAKYWEDGKVSPAPVFL
ncbi:unnamed protein product, partial [Ixodes hexagonus]